MERPSWSKTTVAHHAWWVVFAIFAVGYGLGRRLDSWPQVPIDEPWWADVVLGAFILLVVVVDWWLSLPRLTFTRSIESAGHETIIPAGSRAASATGAMVITVSTARFKVGKTTARARVRLVS